MDNEFEGDQAVSEFTINEMLEMQKSLQEKYKNIWESIEPENGKNKLLWMIGDIVKKNGGEKACSDEGLRKQLIEELSDVLMFYNDVLLCYGISSDELKEIYVSKYQKNMKRW